jgi:hypothetical protein
MRDRDGLARIFDDDIADHAIAQRAGAPERVGKIRGIGGWR